MACEAVRPAGSQRGRPEGRSPRKRGWSGGGGAAWRDPRLWVEGAVDGSQGDVGEAEVVVARVGPQPGEGLGHVDPGAFGDHALGLLDYHPAGQGSGQLLVQALGFGGRTMLDDAESGQV